MALRKKLGETVEELERLRLEHSSLSARYKSAEQELSLAKSDRMFPLAVACTLLTNEAVSLVGKDEIDMIKSLRASLSVDKDLLASELSRVQASLRDAEDSTKMQLSQVSTSIPVSNPSLIILHRSIDCCWNKSHYSVMGYNSGRSYSSERGTSGTFSLQPPLLN